VRHVKESFHAQTTLKPTLGLIQVKQVRTLFELLKNHLINWFHMKCFHYSTSVKCVVCSQARSRSCAAGPAVRRSSLAQMSWSGITVCIRETWTSSSLLYETLYIHTHTHTVYKHSLVKTCQSVSQSVNDSGDMKCNCTTLSKHLCKKQMLLNAYKYALIKVCHIVFDMGTLSGSSHFVHKNFCWLHWASLGYILGVR